MSDDEPIYDHVASDDDYYHIPETTPEERKCKDAFAGSGTLPKKLINSTGSSPSKSSSSGGGGMNNNNNTWKKPGIESLHPSEYEQLRAQLENSEQKVQALIDSNDDMRCEISRLASMVNKAEKQHQQLQQQQ